MLRDLLGEIGLNKRGFLIITILFLSVFGWFYMSLSMITKIMGDLSLKYDTKLAIWTTFYFSIIVASIIGAVLSNKIDKNKFLYTWTVSGTIASLFPATIITGNFEQVSVVTLILGFSFGIGMPSCLAYFTNLTVVENRGRIGGISLLIANFSVPLFGIFFDIFNIPILSTIFALLRGLGLIILFQKNEQQSQANQKVSFASILHDKNFLLYFVTWSMFPLVDRFERVLVDNFLVEWNPNLLNTMGFIEPLVAAFAILAAGLLCDWIGRKKIILSGFVALGIAYGIIGLIPAFEFSWYLYFVIDGIAWGIFSLIFFVVLWGDLAQSSSSEKHYMIGSIPYFLSSIVPILMTQSIIANIELYAAFSLASFFLFIAVLPLVFAPETLPEKKMEIRRLRKFAEEAMKAREKYERKMKEK